MTNSNISNNSKKWQMVKYFNYHGTKIKFAENVNNMIHHVNYLVNGKKYRYYVEPFVGSGAVYLNVPDIFDCYFINDIDPSIVSLWEAVEAYEYYDFVAAREKVLIRFGDIKENKEAYYEFRNWYNARYHTTNDPAKGLYLYLLANSCINSMLRFGPNGMNQSWGHRLYFFTESDYNNIRKKMEKTVITQGDYKECLKDKKDSLIFLDPPYFLRGTSYTENFTEADTLDFLEILYRCAEENSVIYTDVDSNIVNGDFLKFTVRRMRSTGPNTSKDETVDEVCYHNMGTYGKGIQDTP